jgi:hypothetical protein
MGVPIYTYTNVRTGEVLVRPERSARLDSKPAVWELTEEGQPEEKEAEVTRVKGTRKAKETSPKDKPKSRSSSRRSTGRRTSNP